MPDTIATRLDELRAALIGGRLRYADLEAERERIAAELAAQQRQLDMLAGAIAELEWLTQQSAPASLAGALTSCSSSTEDGVTAGGGSEDGGRDRA